MNQLKNDHYVYVLKDINNTIRYIGEGRLDRCKQTVKRPNGYTDILNNGGFIEKIHEGLTKQEAKDLENEYLNKYLGICTEGWDLLNTFGSRTQICLKYSEVSEYFGYETSDPRILISRVPLLGEVLPSKRFVGFIDKHSGYYKVTFNGRQQKAHRLLWVLYNKRDLDPFLVINHIDGDKGNNLPNNLEAVSCSVNSYKSLNKNISRITGISGVSATMSHNGDIKYKGSYTCKNTQVKQEKSFSSSKYGEDVAINLARLFRAIGVAQHESDEAMADAIYNFEKEFKKYNALPDGVSISSNHGKPNQLIHSHLEINGAKYQKRFSINKYGYDEALRLAVEWRESKQEQLTT